MYSNNYSDKGNNNGNDVLFNFALGGAPDLSPLPHDIPPHNP